MAHDIVEAAAWVSSISVLDDGDAHTAALIEAPHAIHANRTQWLKQYTDAIDGSSEALGGVPWELPPLLPFAVETVAAGANSAVAKLVIPAGSVNEDDMILLSWSVLIYDVVGAIGGGTYLMPYCATNTVYVGNTGYCATNDNVAGLGAGEEQTAYGQTRHTVTAGEAAAGYDVRIRNGTGSSGAVKLRAPWRISAPIMRPL